jgi:hypothetical protein
MGQNGRDFIIKKFLEGMPDKSKEETSTQE